LLSMFNDALLGLPLDLHVPQEAAWWWWGIVVVVAAAVGTPRVLLHTGPGVASTALQPAVFGTRRRTGTVAAAAAAVEVAGSTGPSC